MEQAYQDTQIKVQSLTNAGYTVIEKWECEFKAEVKNNPDLAAFVAARSSTAPIDPRDAFFGGRTNATCLYYKAEEGEVISYADVCSLYPWVNKYCKYPVGHPEIFTDNLSTDISQYEGLIKCKVLAPERLLHPVLPVRMDGKLMFPLCLSCSQERPEDGVCQHDDEQRSFTGTWVSDELKKAVEKGYVILAVYEVWHFRNTLQYKPGGEGLFNGYIDHFLKMKAEASGYPPGVVTEEEKDRYVKRYADREGVQLEKEKIASNPGLRSLSKLMLNSFWGKFGQRNNLAQFDYITSLAQLNALLLDETRRITSFVFVSDSVIQVQWKNREEFIEAAPNTCPFIAAYTNPHV